MKITKRADQCPLVGPQADFVGSVLVHYAALEADIAGFATIASETLALTFDTAETAVTDAAGGLISVEHPLDLLGVGRLGQRQHQQDTCLLRVKRI